MTKALESTVVALMAEAMNHVRHSESMRSAYTNYYLALVGTVIAAVAVLFANKPGSPDLSDPIRLAGAVVWAAGLLSLWRAALWTAHVAHDLIIFRRLRQELPLSLTKDVYTGSGGLVRRFSFIPFGPTGGFDVAVAMFGSVLGAVTWAAAALSENDVVAWSLASAAIVAPLLLWLELAADYRSVEHKNCCGQYPPAQGTRA